MLLICVAFLVLGIFAFAETIVNDGGIIQWFASVSLISMSLWLYIRVRSYKKIKNIEIIKAQNTEPEKQATQISQPTASSKKEPEKIHS